ncbi:Response regulatory domain-containing protein [Fusarium keratoplasticum]|uniref:Response regulatory domain-containing protein n=1 Tax=Fusarium keratoplasticum TaxID=1328300 RepID=A0ACC0QKE4_9HYPO|nr:Response regulatory domain-containing protein [Fusarium keratoplasticum]KAI8655156.1 Response regulatory domain-containing protein [Fusarium keratoplasticum]
MSNNPSSTGVEPDDTAPSQQPPLGSTSQPQSSPSGHQQPETSPPSSGELKYLIVEDNMVNRKVMEKLLGKLGIEGQFHMTTNGQEGIDAYKKNPQQCRLIFMDISMPIKGGMEASKEIRDYEREHGLSPAVIVGMHPRMVVTKQFDSQVERFKNEFGMDGAIEKPVRTDALKSVIEKWPV